jgi:hypothetical protein
MLGTERVNKNTCILSTKKYKIIIIKYKKYTVSHMETEFVGSKSGTKTAFTYTGPKYYEVQIL